MKTEQQIKEEFINKLKALLAEYGEGAEIECKDYWKGYTECCEDVRMILTIPAKFDAEGELIQEYCKVILGK